VDILQPREGQLGVWQRWMRHPQNLSLYKLFFHVHYLVGAVIAVYVLLMSVSGSIIVYRGELSAKFSMEWLVNLHENLLSGSVGRLVNGFGAVCVTLLCLTGAVIWWPGIKNWRRSLSVDWKSNFRGSRGTSQRTRVLELPLHSDVGNFWDLLFFSTIL
jgi:uncharacterized iron-regulated membrane protein